MFIHIREHMSLECTISPLLCLLLWNSESFVGVGWHRNISTCFFTEAEGWWDPPGGGIYAIQGVRGDNYEDWVMQSNMRVYGDFWGYFAYNILTPEDCLRNGSAISPTYTTPFLNYHWGFANPKIMVPAIDEQQCTNNYGYGCQIFQPKNGVPATNMWLLR